jgi:hypothetical protein
LRGRGTKRREAVSLFKTICECIPDALVNGASLTPTNRAEGFELRINVDMDSKNLENVRSIVKKQRMVIEENKGSLMIYEPKLEQTEIEIFA